MTTYAFQLCGSLDGWRRDVEANNLSAAVNKYIEILENDGGISALHDGDSYDILTCINNAETKHLRVSIVFKPAIRIDVLNGMPDTRQTRIDDVEVK